MDIFDDKRLTPAVKTALYYFMESVDKSEERGIDQLSHLFGSIAYFVYFLNGPDAYYSNLSALADNTPNISPDARQQIDMVLSVLEIVNEESQGVRGGASCH